MIEISHAQARFLIRQSLDARAGDGRRLPDEQWLALQTHLEGCPECQQYSRQIASVEKDLHHVLAARWQHIAGPEAAAPPGPGVGQDRGRFGLSEIPGRRTIRLQRRQRLWGWALRGMFVALVILAIGALITWNRARRGEAVGTSPIVTALPPATPTPAPPAYFDGVVMYAGNGVREAGAAGGSNSEIYLLQTQGSRVETANLTQNPAQDTDPAWSPDGEWIAFLSDRSGKAEVYAMTVAGSRVTQLTDEPDIAWDGAPVWSPDGQWLALSGKRVNQGNVSWLYLVAMDHNTAAHPLAVPGSRGVNTPARFVRTPDGAMNLIFQQPADPTLLDSGSIMSIQLPGGEQFDLTLLDESAKALLPSGGFDINSQYDAVNLVYIANTNTSTDLRGLRIPVTGGSQSFIMDQADFGTVQDITLIPSISRVAYLRLDPSANCWKINLRPIYLSSDVWSFDGLCVDGGLSSGQWASSSAWGAVIGHEQGKDAAPQLWAVHLPSVRASVSEPNEPIFYSLGDAGVIDGTPLVRPSAPRLEIAPQPAVAPFALPPESALPDPLPAGKVVLSVPEGANRRIEIMDAAGSNRSVVQEADAVNTCPALSPDGRRLAYLSNRASIFPNTNQVFVRDLSQPGMPEVRLHLPNIDYAGYECPVWSPDGKSLAMVGHLYGLSYLAIFSVETKVDAGGTPTPGTLPTHMPEDGLLETGVYLTVETPSAGLPPAWTPDSKSVYLGFPRRMGFPPVVNLYQWNGPDKDISSPGAVLKFSDGWEDVLGLSISPDGGQLVVLAEKSAEHSSVPAPSNTVMLQLYDRLTMNVLNEWDLDKYVPGIISHPGRFFWQVDGQLLFAYPTSRLAARAVSLVRIDPLLDTRQVVAASPDIIYDWTVMGDWLLFASESGLWGGTMPGPSALSVIPRWLRGDVVAELESSGP
jgi:hypothetical protein